MSERAAADESFRVGVDHRLFRLPLVGSGYLILVNLRFARTLSILIRGGVGITESMALAGRSTGSAWVARQVDQAAEAVRHGSSIADALRRVVPLSRFLPGWIQTGETSGSLDRMLDRAADRCQEQWTRFVARRLALLEPALILVIGAVVLTVAVAIILPVLALNRAMG